MEDKKTENTEPESQTVKPKRRGYLETRLSRPSLEESKAATPAKPKKPAEAPPVQDPQAIIKHRQEARKLAENQRKQYFGVAYRTRQFLREMDGDFTREQVMNLARYKTAANPEEFGAAGANRAHEILLEQGFGKITSLSSEQTRLLAEVFSKQLPDDGSQDFFNRFMRGEKIEEASYKEIDGAYLGTKDS